MTMQATAREHDKREAEITRVAAMPRYSSVKNFKGPDAELKAYQFGMWFGCIISRGAKTARRFSERAQLYCDNWGLDTYAQSFDKAMGEVANTSGGYLVAAGFSNDLIALKEEYGVFRRNTKVVPMPGETMTVPRRSGGVTVYYPSEGVAITDSSKAWDAVSLAARKYAGLVLYSSELSEDAIISIGDDLMGELAYAFAQAEDTNAFNGDGTSTYAGTTGVRQRLLDVYTTGGGKGLILGAGNAWSELTSANFNSVAGALPAYARGRAKWYCSGIFYETVMAAVGPSVGVRIVDTANGPRPTFRGFPVECAQVMPFTEANSQIPVILGDLMSGSKLGESREVLIAIADQYKFPEDQFAVRGTQRVDINIHDVGDANAAGPIVGLITASS